MVRTPLLLFPPPLSQDMLSVVRRSGRTPATLSADTKATLWVFVAKSVELHVTESVYGIDTLNIPSPVTKKERLVWEPAPPEKRTSFNEPIVPAWEASSSRPLADDACPFTKPSIAEYAKEAAVKGQS